LGTGSTLGERAETPAGIGHDGFVAMGRMPSSMACMNGDELHALIEEDVIDALARALQFSGWLLDRVDPLRRLSDVAPIAHLAGGGYMPWRTRAEHAASPNEGTMGQGGNHTTVTLTPPWRHRQALTHDADRIAEDLVTLLRRELR
jgi:hypothetical protein